MCALQCLSEVLFFSIGCCAVSFFSALDSSRATSGSPLFTKPSLLVPQNIPERVLFGFVLPSYARSINYPLSSPVFLTLFAPGIDVRPGKNFELFSQVYLASCSVGFLIMVSSSLFLLLLKIYRD